MRIKLAIATGAVAVVLGTATAAYAVVAQGWMNPTTTGNVLPIDDNHSPVGPVPPAATPVTAASTSSADGHGGEPQPGDDRSDDPGQDHGQDHGQDPGRDHGGVAPATTSRTATATGDRGREPEPGDDRGGPSTSTPAPAPASQAAATPSDDRGRGRGGDDPGGHH